MAMVSRLEHRSTSDRSLRTTRVLLVGERFLLLDALRVALQGHRMEVAITGAGRRAVEEALTAFQPQVIVLDGTNSPIDVVIRSIHTLVDDGRLLAGIAAEGVSVEAARMVGGGADLIFGLDMEIAAFAGALTRALEGTAAMPLDQRYALEELLRKYRAAEQRRWLPFDELTTRERAIFELVYGGLSADQIADTACVSLSTVRSHIRNILTKLNVNSQLAAVALARSNNWFPGDSVEVGG